MWCSIKQEVKTSQDKSKNNKVNNVRNNNRFKDQFKQGGIYTKCKYYNVNGVYLKL